MTDPIAEILINKDSLILQVFFALDILEIYSFRLIIYPEQKIKTTKKYIFFPL